MNKLPPLGVNVDIPLCVLPYVINTAGYAVQFEINMISDNQTEQKQIERMNAIMMTLTELAAEIVSAHASTTAMTTEELLQEIARVYETLKSLEAGAVEAGAETAEAAPELTAKQSIKNNEIICMICGKGGMKTLTRHLTQFHGMKPGEYRKQFGLPSGQPLTAKKFSAERKRVALERNLAGNLAKAREVRAAKLAAAKGATTKAKKPAVKKASAKSAEAGKGE